jgi:predicted transcriptional regulator
MTPNSDSIAEDKGTAQKLIIEMVTAGATKVAIAKAVGVTDMTILSVSQGKTKVFRKLKKLQSVYSKWKAGKLDLGGKRGKKVIEAPDTEEVLVGTMKTGGKMSSVKKPRVARKPVVAEKTKRGRRTHKKQAVAVQTGFQIPEVTEEMVAGVEEQIRKLQAQAKYMRDIIALRKKYGM